MKPKFVRILLLMMLTACSRPFYLPLAPTFSPKEIETLRAVPTETPYLYAFPPSPKITAPIVYPPPGDSIFTSPLSKVYPTPYPTSDSPSLKSLPLLIHLILNKEDIPYSNDPFFGDLLPSEIQPWDASKQLLDKCNIDCGMMVWNNPERQKTFVIAMYEVNEKDAARNQVSESLQYELSHFVYKQGTISVKGLPQQSWIVATNGVRGTVGDRVTFQTSWGPVIMIISEQMATRDMILEEDNLEHYFEAIQKLALIQIEKLKNAGYPK